MPAHRLFNAKQALEKEIKDLYLQMTVGNLIAATGTLDLTADIVLTSVAAGSPRNTQTFTLEVAAAAANPTNTILAAFTGTAAAIVCTVTPNDGTNTGSPASAVLDLTNDVTISTTTDTAARNTNTFTIQVLAAAANPTDTILAETSGTAAATVLTITPNDGTNNTATPVDLTTAELAELIATGAVVGKTVTVTDTGSLLDGLTASGGGGAALADAGEGDGVIGTFAGGVADAAIDLTTAELTELINTGAVVGKTVTVTDGSSLRALQTATGGGATALANSGEGDSVVATFAGGSAAQPTLVSNRGISGVVRNGPGDYSITLSDTFFAMKSSSAIHLSSTAQDIRFQIHSETVNASATKAIRIVALTGTTPVDPANSSKIFLKAELKNSSVA